MPKKILVIRFSSIGDIVLTTPILRAIQEQSGAQVHFLTKPQFAPLVTHNPHVKKVFTLAEDFNQTVTELKAERYDHVVDLHHNIRTKRLKIALGIPSTAFPKLNFEKWLLVRFGINRLPDLHVVDRYFQAAGILNVEKDGKGLDFFIPPDREIDLPATFGFQPNEYTAIVIGAAHRTKCLTTDQIAALCKEIDRPVILMGGPGELDKAKQILQITDSKLVKNACSGFDILQSASIIRQAAVVISHDTGLMHIAAAYKRPQVVVWGNTIPQFGMYPYYGSTIVPWKSFEQPDLKCRPCSKIGFEKCPKGHFKCILNHNPRDIAQAARSLAGDY